MTVMLVMFFYGHGDDIRVGFDCDVCWFDFGSMHVVVVSIVIWYGGSVGVAGYLVGLFIVYVNSDMHVDIRGVDDIAVVIYVGIVHDSDVDTRLCCYMLILYIYSVCVRIRGVTVVCTYMNISPYTMYQCIYTLYCHVRYVY